MGTIVLISYLMPPALMFIALYFILVQLGLQNTLMSLMITYPSFTLPFAIWLMMGYYPLDPRGAGGRRHDRRLQPGAGVLPSGPAAGRPALLAVAMFAVTQAWNEFLYAFTFIRSAERFTLPSGSGMIIGDVQPWGELMAASLMTAVPVIVIYMLGQKFMVAGLTAGAASRLGARRRTGSDGWATPNVPVPGKPDTPRLRLDNAAWRSVSGADRRVAGLRNAMRVSRRPRRQSGRTAARRSSGGTFFGSSRAPHRSGTSRRLARER